MRKSRVENCLLLPLNGSLVKVVQLPTCAAPLLQVSVAVVAFLRCWFDVRLDARGSRRPRGACGLLDTLQPHQQLW